MYIGWPKLDFPREGEIMSDSTASARESMATAGKSRDECVAIHWFRHGLRLHDNPALLQAMQKAKKVYPVFIFDGAVAGTWNR